MDCDHINWATWNFITQLISPLSRLLARKISAICANRTSSNLGLNRGGVGKIGRISEAVRDRAHDD